MSRGAPGLLAIAALLCAVSGSAFAYFSAGGAGSASAEVTTFGKPAITAANPSGNSVALSWSAVAAPGAGAVTYYVSRDGGAAAGTCPSAAAPKAVTSCTDSGVATGNHTYTVTAVWSSWSATSAGAAAKITGGTVTHFTISASTTTPAVGATTNLTITAKDDDEATVTSYTGLHSLVFSGAASSPGGTAPTVTNSSGTAIAFGSSTTINFSAGVASVSSSKNGGMKIFRAGAASVVATEGSITTSTPLSVVPASGAPTKFTLAGGTTTPTAGAENGLTITAVDTYGNAAASYTGSHNLVFSGASASPGGNAPTVADATGAEVAFGSATAIDFSAGVATSAAGLNGAMTLYKSGSASVKATEGSLTNSTALALTVAAGQATKLVLTSSTATPVAAASSNLTTTAQDGFGNTASSYAGPKGIVFSGPVASPAGTLPTVVDRSGTVVPFGTETSLEFSAGVAAVKSSKNGLMRLYKAGAASVAASDGTISSAVPLALTVGTGSAARWALANVTASAGSVAATCFFTCSVTGLGNGGKISANVSVTDSAGNPISGVGSGHAAKVTVTSGGAIAGTPLTIPAVGLALSATPFTYTAPASGAFTHTITVAASAGTSYTSATITASR